MNNPKQILGQLNKWGRLAVDSISNNLASRKYQKDGWQVRSRRTIYILVVTEFLSEELGLSSLLEHSRGPQQSQRSSTPHPTSSK